MTLHEQIKIEIKRTIKLKNYLLKNRQPEGIRKLNADLMRAKDALTSNKTGKMRIALSMLRGNPDLEELKKWMKLRLLP